MAIKRREGLRVLDIDIAPQLASKDFVPDLDDESPLLLYSILLFY